MGWRRFTGGIASSVHRLSVGTPDGRVHQVVLKRWVGGDGDNREALAQIHREVGALAALEGTTITAPRPVAWSDGTETDGWPSLLMTRVPGRVWLDPSEPEEWLTQLATTLVQIHELPPSLAAVEPWTPDRDDWVPSDAVRPDVWRAAAELVEGPAPSRRALIHGDYQHFNVLWRRGRLNGVIDWTWSGVGPPERDLGHCRLNLAVLYSAERAERFKAIYESVSGRRTEPWWDVYELLRYNDGWPKFIPIQVYGRVPVPAGMTARVEALLATVLADG